MTEAETKVTEFIMRVGFEMRQLLFKNLAEHYQDPMEMSNALFATLLNFTTNTLCDASQDGAELENVKALIKSMEDWVNKIGDKRVFALYQKNFNKVTIAPEGVQ